MPINKSKINKPQHIGDGVYVDFDGYQVSIAVNHHNNIQVYLDEQVQSNLIEYLQSLHSTEDTK